MSLSVHIEKQLHNFLLKMDFESENEVLSLLGASGCGKSMTLKCIAGIEKPDKGEIILNGRILFDSEKGINLSPQKRRVGYLFQQYALFPQMTVEQNIRCGVRNQNESQNLVEEMVRKMHLEGLEKKYPRHLSGGEQQRTALARIMVNEPEVLLFDEPFSALDTHLRFKLENEIRMLVKDFSNPVLLVSHNRDEVFRMSSKIAVMNQGKIEKMGSREEIFMNPETIHGAILTGCKNLYACEIRDAHHVYIPDLEVTLRTEHDASKARFVGVRMHDVAIGGEENTLEGVLLEEVENPFSYVAAFHIASGGEIRLETNKELWENQRAQKLTLSIPAQKLLLLKD